MSVNIDAGPKTALVVGATGAIGRALVRQLCEMRPDYGRVLAWTRRPLLYSHDKLFVEEEVDFDRMDKMPPERVHDIYCALGTTLKQAGSENEFLHVDVGYPKLLAKWGRKAGAQCFVLLSAPGADAQSRCFFLRAKGMAEDAVRGARFRSYIIVRPPLIDDQREDFRLVELLGISMFQLLGRVLPQQLDKWRPMSGGAVASAILSVTQNPQAGEQVVYPYETQLPPRADPIED
ncbi:MAG: NAD-dependent epimerase/dehydratase family protein [Ottowia sp.]